MITDIFSWNFIVSVWRKSEILQLQLLECWIFYFLKTTTNGETSDNRSRFQISIQLIFVKCFWNGWLSTRIGQCLSIKNYFLTLQNTIQNIIIIIVFSFVQDFFDLPSPIFWDTFNSASTLTFNLSLTWISISQLVSRFSFPDLNVWNNHRTM